MFDWAYSCSVIAVAFDHLLILLGLLGHVLLGLLQQFLHSTQVYTYTTSTTCKVCVVSNCPNQVCRSSDNPRQACQVAHWADDTHNLTSSAFTSTKTIITSLLSFCLSICKHSYSCNFDSILMKFCTVIRDQKTKIEFVWDKNLITPNPILPQFLKICITAYADFKVI